MAGTFGFKKLLVLVLVATLVTLTIAIRAIMKRCEASCEIQPYFTRFCLCVFILVGLASMAMMNRWRLEIYTNETPEVDGLVALQTMPNRIYVHNMTFFLEKYAAVIGVFLFGTGAVMQHIFYLAGELQCLKYITDTEYMPIDKIELKLTDLSKLFSSKDKFNENDDVAYGDALDKISFLALHALELIFFGLQIPFLCHFRRYCTIRRKHWVHHMVVCVIATNIAIWMYTFLTESQLLFVYGPHDDVVYWTSMRAACFTQTTPLNSFTSHTLEAITFPLTMEFALAATEILVHLWLLPYQYNQIEDEVPLLGQGAGENPLLGYGAAMARDESDIDQAPRPGGSEHEQDGFLVIDSRGKSYIYTPPRESTQLTCLQNMWMKFTSCFNVYTGLLMSLLEITIVGIATIHGGAPAESEWRKTLDIPIEIMVLFSFIPNLIIYIHCFVIVQSFHRKRPNIRGILGSDIMLLVGLVSIITLTVVELTTFIKRLSSTEISGYDKSKDGLSTVSYVILMPQFVIQTLIIYYGRRREGNLRHVFYPSLQANLSYLAMFNFAQWTKDSFFISHDDFVDMGTNDILQRLCMPPCIYFRFLSIFLLINIKHQFREDEIKYWVAQFHGLPPDHYVRVRDNAT